MILLNPGPVNVCERVRQALMRPDICHRESEFSDLLGRIQQKLLKAFVPGAEADYVAVLLTGSGTAAVESAVMSCLPTGKRMLVLNNGVYGERLSSMIGLHRLGVSELKYGMARSGLIRNEFVWRYASIRKCMRSAMVHHETTTGLINPIQEIAEVVDSQNRVFVVDSVSGLGGEPSILPARTSIWWRVPPANASKAFPASRSCCFARGFWSGCEVIPSDRGIST